MTEYDYIVRQNARAVFLHPQTIRGHRYWYLRESKRVGGRVVTVMNKYLGSDKTLMEKLLAAERRGLPEIEVESFPFGNEAALLGADEELGFTKIVEQVTGSRATALACLAFIEGRSEEPVSKNRMPEWFSGSLLRVLIPDMPSLTCRMYLHHMDKLTDDAVHEINFLLAKRMIELGHNPSLVFFDLTNFSTEQQPPDDDPDRLLARCGHAKDGNNQAKLVGLATATTAAHLPVFHQVYPGNENDARLFSEVAESMVSNLLKLGIASEDLVFVFDKGVNSEENWTALTGKKVHFVGSLKRLQVQDLLARPASSYKKIYVTEQEEEIRGFRVKRTVMGVDGTVVFAFNQSAKKRQEIDYEKAKKRFLDGCADIAGRMSKKHRGRRSSLQSVTERIEDKLPMKWRGVLKYHVGASLDDGFTKFAVRAWIDEKKEKTIRAGFGKTVIFTDRGDWDDEKIVRTYYARSAMEEDYHVLKDVLLMPVMPIFHRLDDRIKVHAFLMVVGLLMYRWVQMRAQEALKRKVSIDRLAYLLKGVRVAAVTEVGGKKARFVLEKQDDERKKLVGVLNLARFVPN